jgi:hypothetical protein
MAIRRWVLSWSFAGLFLATAPLFGGMIDFTTWSEVQDPPSAYFVGSVDSPSRATLSVTGGPVSAATDIGYQSINGNSFASSTSGYAFDPSSDFSVAVDFSLAASGSGGLGIGFGIGEDRNGANSAGVAMMTVNGVPAFFFGGAARINDVNQPAQLIPVAAQSSGRLVLSYNAASGNVQVGVSTNGDDTPEGAATFNGIEKNWNNQPLLASFFLRSDNSLSSAWTSGTASAVFTDFHVISGTPIAVPEPSSIALLAIAAGILLYVRRKRDAKPVC